MEGGSETCSSGSRNLTWPGVSMFIFWLCLLLSHVWHAVNAGTVGPLGDEHDRCVSMVQRQSSARFAHGRVTARPWEARPASCRPFRVKRTPPEKLSRKNVLVLLLASHVLAFYNHLAKVNNYIMASYHKAGVFLSQALSNLSCILVLSGGVGLVLSTHIGVVLMFRLVLSVKNEGMSRRCSLFRFPTKHKSRVRVWCARFTVKVVKVLFFL